MEEEAVPRPRPILTTTGAVVLGAMPPAAARGSGAESRQAIGMVGGSGMPLGTLLTLFVVSTVYSLIARKAANEATIVVPAPAE